MSPTGDMLTLTLIQGVLNTFVLFLARVIGFAVDRVVLRNEGGIGIGYFVTTIVAQIVLGILASIVVMWFSRQREFRADAKGAELAGRGNMIARPGTPQGVERDARHHAGVHGGIRNLKRGPSGVEGRSSRQHPPLDARIAALRSLGDGLVPSRTPESARRGRACPRPASQTRPSARGGTGLSHPATADARIGS